MTYQLRCPSCGSPIGYGNFADGPNGDVIHSTSISGIRVSRNQISVPEPQVAALEQPVAPFPTAQPADAVSALPEDQVQTPPQVGPVPGEQTPASGEDMPPCS